MKLLGSICNLSWLLKRILSGAVNMFIVKAQTKKDVTRKI